MKTKSNQTKLKPAFTLQDWTQQAWQNIAPYWPLKNLIAVNPLKGLEDIPFDKALIQGAAYFEQNDLPEGMKQVNQATIKWCQAFFDGGQSTLSMPLRRQGLYHAWRQLAPWDFELYQGDLKKQARLQSLPDTAEKAVEEALKILCIPDNEIPLFLTLLLVTLPGWSAYVRYQFEWSCEQGSYPVTAMDYLALRIVSTVSIWPEAADLITWHKQTIPKTTALQSIQKNEEAYRLELIEKLSSKTIIPQSKLTSPLAQFVFCIDVRSEPFRRALEAQGRYETFGFAGFFGVPIQVKNQLNEETYPSCPVLLKPKHTIFQQTKTSSKITENVKLTKRVYQSLKYTFITPFALAEAIGPISGFWMFLRTFFPKKAAALAPYLSPSGLSDQLETLNIDSIPFEDQCSYAEGALRLIGLTNNFAPFVILCGHGSASTNNTFATALDCGACGGRHGDTNAKVLAYILNCLKVRKTLRERGINIPDSTFFLSAKHNTTTDEASLYHYKGSDGLNLLQEIKEDLFRAQQMNRTWRSSLLVKNYSDESTPIRSINWAETRPEWGLARNASFIIGPRSLTQNLDLEGRAFLHSYDWQQDPEGKDLSTILNAPLVVAQWINSQYLFSSLNNVAYGAGSKITHNVTSKIGVMQGNASDLMHGLPLQSIFKNDWERYHDPMRLLAVVFAPRHIISPIINQSPTLTKLVCNQWIHMACLDPNDQQIYFMNRSLTWNRYP